MIEINFSKDDIAELDKEMFSHSHPMIQKRILTLILKSHKLPHATICNIVNITEKTLTNYLKLYLNGGIKSLMSLNYKGSVNELKEHPFDLEKYFIENPVRSSKEAKAIIEEKTGIIRSLTQVRAFLTGIGLKYLKVGHVPGKSTGEDKIKEQEDFVENEITPAIQKGKDGKSVVFFWMPPTLSTVHF